MGKNHRHKKNLKSEKAKTHLKTATRTKFLPKGQNVTNTEFKLKPIVIVSQLQSKISEDGQRNLDLKTVLSRLNHYNENMKIKACEDMEYLIKNSKSKLAGGNVPVVIQTLAEFIQTKLPKARKAGLAVINTFLSNFPETQVTPYFHYFSVNLRCAMTHIDRNIQEDSILFLDSFLNSVPTLTAKHANQILPDFLMLISKLRNDADFKRTVSLNLKSKFTSIGWRIVVLSRLYVFLEAIMSQRISNEMEVDAHNTDVLFDPNSSNGKAIYKSWDALFNPKMYVIGLPLEEKENEDVINKQFSVLVPLLLETWLEGAPVKLPSKEITYMSEENAMLLSCVIKVFHLLCSYSRREDNKMTMTVTVEGEKLIKNLVQNLPYCLINRPKQKDKPNKFMNMFITTDVKCIQENLLICYIYLITFCNSPFKTKQNEISNIISFITDCLLKDYASANVDITYLMMILKHLLIDKAKVWHRNKVPVTSILENSVHLYNNGNLKQSTKSVLLKLLATVDYDPLLKNECYESWLENLPKLLSEGKIISGHVICSMLDLSRKNKVAFNRGYLKEFPLILEKLPELKVNDTNDSEAIKEKVIDILFYAPPLKDGVQLLETLLENSPYGTRVKYMLKLRKKFQRD